MENTSKYIQYARLIARFISNDLNDQELSELEDWKSKNTDNMILFNRIVEDKNWVLNQKRINLVKGSRRCQYN